MNKAGFVSIRTKLMLLLCVLLVAVNLVAQAFNYRLLQQVQAKAQTERLAVLERTLANLVERFGDRFQSTAADWVEKVDELMEGDDAHNASEQFFSGLEHLQVLSLQGRVLYPKAQPADDLPGHAPLNRQALAQVLHKMAPANFIACTHGDECMFESYVPAILKDGRQVVIHASYGLDDLLLDFRQLGNADLAFVVQPGQADASANSPWGLPLAQVTQADTTLPLLRSLAQRVPAETLSRDGGRVWLDDRFLLVKAITLPPTRTYGLHQVLLLSDETAHVAESQRRAQQLFALSTLSMVVVGLLLGWMLGKPIQRLRDLARALPLLARQEYEQASAQIARLGRRGRYRDELDVLVETAATLNQQLSSLQHAQEEAQTRREAQARAEAMNTRLEEQVAQRTSELEAAVIEATRANEAKSAFLTSMSHELRTPLNAIIGFSQLIEMDDELDPGHKENLTEVVKAGRHLLGLINEILDLSKIEAGQMVLSLEPVSLAEVVDECERLIAPLADAKRIALAMQVAPGLVVQADMMRLRQVLLNVLSNAVKYNRQGGHVWLSARVQDDGQVRVAIRDDGVGIAPAFQAHIFQPFNRGAAEGGFIEGTGIGLAITQRLVLLMGGQIGFSSEQGVGSEFWITLPAAALPGVQDVPLAEAIPATAAPEAQQQVVLCVDDNPANLRLITQIMAQRPQLKVLSALGARLGIELAEAHRPHLILLDINMPDMNGYEVLAYLRKNPALAQTPIVAITANAMRGDIERGKAAGFSDYFTKPLDVPNFLAAVDKLLA